MLRFAGLFESRMGLTPLARMVEPIPAHAGIVGETDRDGLLSPPGDFCHTF
jgi:hypothetical protein